MSSTFDGLSLTNSRDLTCNNIYLNYDNDIKNILDIFAFKGDITNIVGLPPSTLNTLQELATALNNNPNFFQYVKDQLDLKRDISDSYSKSFIDTLVSTYYTKTQTDSLLNNKLNSSEITKYYTMTQTSDLFLDKNTWDTGFGNLLTSLNTKANASNLQNNYYTKTTTDSILESYYDKATIDNTFSNYYNKTDIDTTLDNYYDKAYDDFTVSILYSNINSKASISEISNFYTKTTTNSLLDGYYPKGYIDTAFSKYYTITGVNSLLTNKVDNTTLNNYYDKTYINNSLNNFYQKYQVDGLFNDYYNLTTTNALYASSGTVFGLSNTVGSHITEIVNIKTTLPSFLQTTSFNTTMPNYLLKTEFTSGSFVNITQLNALNTTTTSTITYVNNIYNTVNNNTSSITDVSGTLNSVITEVSNIKTTLPSFLQTTNFNTTIGSYLTNANFNTTIGSYLPTSSFNTTIGSYLKTADYNTSAATYLTTANFNTTIGSYLPTSTYTNTILSRLNTDSANITNINTTLPSFLQTSNFNTTIGSYLTTTNFNTTIGSYLKAADYNTSAATYLTTTNFTNTLGSYLKTADYNTSAATYLPTASFNNTIGSYLTTTNFNSTIGSYLPTSNFNSTIASYLTTANFNSTISSYLTTAAFNTTLTSRLGGYATTTTTNSIITNVNNLTTTTNSIITNANNLTTTTNSIIATKQNKHLFTLPPVSNNWVLLGSLNTSQTGNITAIEIYSQNYYSASAFDEMRAVIQFSTANGASWIAGSDGTNFYGEASMVSTNNIANWQVSIQQVSQTSYKIYYYTGAYPGNGVFNVMSADTFTYSGTQVAPSGCCINPTVVYTIGLNGSNNGDMSIDTIRSNYFLSQGAGFNIYNNSSTQLASFTDTGSTINSSLNISGNAILNTVSCNSIFLSSTATANSNFHIGGALRVNGTQLNIGAVSLNSTLNVSGAATLSSSLNTIGNISSPNLNITGNITTSGRIQTTYLSVLQNATIPNLHIGQVATTTSIFMQNGGNITCPGSFKMYSTSGIQTWNNGTITSAFSDSFIGLYSDTLLTESVLGGDAKLTLQNQTSGTASLYLSTNGTFNSRLYQDPLGNVNFNVNISNTSVLPLQLNTNGVVNVNSSNSITNKILVLYDNGVSDTPATATNYSGIGTQTGGAMRYQVPTATSTHRFFCGTTQSFFITNGSGASGSDIRFKSDIQDITNALDKVKQLQGKTFVYNGCSGRQMGMIAQDVKPIVPEVVMEDDEGYHLMCYDRLVALLIESIKELEQRVQILENKI